MGGVEYQVTKVDPTDPETKGMVYQVHKVSEEIAATLGGKVYRARIINDPTEPTVAGKVYQIVLIGDPTDPAVKGKVYNAILTGGSEAVVVGPAVSPLELPDAIADSLVYVKAFGGTEQNGTPTPDAPMDIVSNNGVLKYGAIGKNLLNLGAPGVIYGDFINDSGTVVHDNTSTISDFIPCTEGAYYTAQAVALSAGSNLRIHGYDENKNWVQLLAKSPASVGVVTTATCQIPAGIKYIKVCGYMMGSPGKDAMLELGSTASSYEPYRAGIYADGTVETINVHGKNLFNPDTNTNGYRLTDTGTVTSDNNAFYTAHIPVVAGSTYTYNQNTGASIILRICEYDSANALVKLNKYSSAGQQTVTITMSANTSYIIISADNRFVSSPPQLELGSTATDYAPYYNGGTATAEMLLKVGDYQDVQSIIDGVVTRKVGIKVLDGTEPWVSAGTGAATDYLVAIRKSEFSSDIDTSASYSSFLCSHLKMGTSDAENTLSITAATYGVRLGLNTSITGTAGGATKLANAKQWLADQYAAGTPVIIIYPLATAITESVAGQTLQVTDGDNVLEITQASLTGLELEAQYNAAVSLTIQEVQDANLDNNVTVTIQ